MEFKGSKGDWKIEEVFTTTGTFFKVLGDISVCNITTRNQDIGYENAKLIADAGTTVNKCGLIPSELLAQRNDLLESLQKARFDLILLGARRDAPMLNDIDFAINKALTSK
jgi:hypothetical protein